MKLEDFLKMQAKDISDFRAALTKETDRGCALFAASYLDNALSDLLFCALAYDKKIDDDLFNGNAPLASFAARIKLAFYLGKISKIERRDFDLIRKIRNEFAHNAEPIVFNTNKIASRCSELSFSYHDKDAKTRAHFTAACLGLLGHLHVETLKCEAPEIKGDNAPSDKQKATRREEVAAQLEKLLTDRDADNSS